MQQLTTECPNCAVPLMLDDGTDQMPRAVYCEECQEEFPAVLARLDGAAEEKLRLWPLLDRALNALDTIAAVQKREHYITLRIDLRRELGKETAR